MKKLVLISLLIGLLSCEDTKKATVKSNSNTNVEALDEKITQESNPTITKENNIPEKKIYPKITPNNVVEFLTEYGANNPETKVRVSTVHGTIDIQLYKDTPLHRANFIYLVKQKYFDDTFFHRVAPNFIIQAGNSDLKSTSQKKEKLFLQNTDYRQNLIREEFINMEPFLGLRSIAKTQIKCPLPMSFLFLSAQKIVRIILMEIIPYLEK